MDESIAIANSVRKKLTDTANYIGENTGDCDYPMHLYELTRLDRIANEGIKTCEVHDEHKTILPPQKRSDNET